MIRTVEATIETDGTIRLHESVSLSSPRRALVTILEEPASVALADEVTLLSQASLAEEWNRQEEDEAWSSLQEARS
jgi:hypothetical protein